MCLATFFRLQGTVNGESLDAVKVESDPSSAISPGEESYPIRNVMCSFHMASEQGILNRYNYTNCIKKKKPRSNEQENMNQDHHH